jgi:hypothetical protein
MHSSVKLKNLYSFSVILSGLIPLGGVEKVLFNHKVHKEGTKGTKLKSCNSVLCDLCVEPL